MAGHDPAEESKPAAGDGDQGGPVIGWAWGAGDQASLLQQAGLVGQAAAAVDDAVGQLGHGQLPAGSAEAGEDLELHVADAALSTQLLLDLVLEQADGLTAWQSLFEYAGLTAGQSILVNGAGGAVGGYAVQLAARAGATVIATARARNSGRLRSYGADRIIDHTATPLPDAAAGHRFDVVLNLVRITPEEAADLTDLAVDGGVFVSTTTPGPDDAGRGVRTARVYARSDAAQLAALVASVDAGDLKIDVAQRLPLTDLPVVHDQSAAGQLPGKTILIP